MHLVFAPEKCFTYTLQFPCNFRKISQLLTCLILLLPNIITDFFLWSFLLSAFDVDNLSLFVFPDLLLLQPLILVFCWLLHFSLFSSDGVSFNSFFLLDFCFFISCCSRFYKSILFCWWFVLKRFYVVFWYSWFVFIILLHLDIWSSNEFTSWFFLLILSRERESGFPYDLSISLNDFHVSLLYLFVMLGICVSRSLALALVSGPGPGPRPQFLFDGPGPKFVFHGSSLQFVFACSSLYS